MRILIVDDDKTFCEFLTEVLSKKGYDIDWTTHSLEGYKMSLRKRYDFFVFDVRMSPLLGTELAEGLKDQSPETNIILISALLTRRYDARLEASESDFCPSLSQQTTF